MKEDEQEPRISSAAEIEREIRSKRPYSLAEAIGRAAGDLLHGHSPATGRRQAESEIEELLEAHLADSEGALHTVLARRVVESEVLLSSGYERPFDALVQVTELLLGSTERLNRFVRVVDMEWGRMYSERPFFEADGQAPHRDDPYTRNSVRGTLSSLLEGLRSEPTEGGADR